MTSKAHPATNVRAYVLAGYRFAGAELGMEGAAKVAAKVFGASVRAAIDSEDADALRAIRHDFQIGDFMRRLVKSREIAADPLLANDFNDDMWERTRALFYAQSFHSEADRKAGVPRRGKVQEAAFDAARKSWSRMLKAAGIKSPDKRGGARAKPQAEAAKPEAAKPEAAKPEAAKPEAEAAKPQAESVPLAKSNAAVAKWLNEQSAIMTTFLSRASVDGGVTVPENVKAVVDAFRRDLEAAIKANKANK